MRFITLMATTAGTVELNELAAYVYAEVSQLRKSSGNAKSTR